MMNFSIIQRGCTLRRSAFQEWIWLRCAATLLLIGLCPVCVAAIYKCTASDGRPVFSDEPCASDAQKVEVKAQPPIAADQGQPDVASGSSAIAKCVNGQYDPWLRDQDPKPTPEARSAKRLEVAQKCRAALSTPGALNIFAGANIATAPSPPPTTARPATRTSASAAPPSQIGSPERMRGNLECKLSEYQQWVDHLGHAPDESESRDAHARVDRLCGQRFNEPQAGAAIAH